METTTLLTFLFLLSLAAFAGLGLASKIPPLLNGPVLASAGALTGLVVLGAILLANQRGFGQPSKWLALAALVLATVNAVGGVAATGRLLAGNKNKPRQTGA